MIKFEDKFIHFRWSDELEGKQVFYADSISMLEQNFAAGNRGYVHESGREEYPFAITDDANFKFVYYDPNFDCKVAFNKGKKIQCRMDKSCVWRDITDPCWEDETEYRIKPGLAWSDLHIGDILRQFNGSIVSSVTAFDMADVTNHVQLAGWGWVSDTELAEKWFKL